MWTGTSRAGDLSCGPDSGPCDEAGSSDRRVRHLPDEVKQRLRVRAAENGRSMEAEVREILVNAVAEEEPSVDLTWVEALIALGDEFGGIHLELPPRDGIAPAWDFGAR